MKKAEIEVGGLYSARMSGRYATVRVDTIREKSDHNGRTVTVFDVTNLATRRKSTFRSAARFRGRAEPPKPTNVEEITGRVLNGESGLKVSSVEPVAPIQRSSEVSVDDAPPTGSEEGEQCSDPTPATYAAELGGTPTTGTSATTALNPARAVAAPENESGIVPTTYVGFAAKIAALRDAPTTGLTRQQEDIIATTKEVEAGGRYPTINGQRVVVIGAGAGTGKTFTLKQLEQVLMGNGQYTAFNSSLVAESKAKFKRAACNTTHSLAFRAVGKRFQHRLNSARVRSREVAQRLGIGDLGVELPEAVAPYDDGRPQVRQLKAQFLAGQVVQAIRKFCQSADPEVAAKHFDYFPGLDESGKHDNSNRVKDYLLPFARAAWADLISVDGTLQFSHDCYVKLWEMDHPVIAADYILLDEAQDTAPVMLSILQQQTHALLVLVGDDNQQIYEWRGAVNAMTAFPGAPRRLLSQSFRFGQVVADVANAVLARLDRATDLVMTGLPSIPSRVCRVASPRCYLYRTNAGAVGKLMSGIDEGKRGHLIGGTDEVVKFCRAALDLQRGQGTAHPELGCFTKWSEVQEYSKEAEGKDLRLMVKLIDAFTARKIISVLENMPPEDQADFVTSTAHRSKGREWPSVKLGQDFPTANKLSDSECRLVYVATTRAQEELDVTECPTFCGGPGRVGGGEDGGGGENSWVPGVEVEYTAPMPSEGDLAAYRAARIAPAPPTIAPPQAAGQILAQPLPDAAGAAVAPGNGVPAAAPPPSGEVVRQMVAASTERVVTYAKLPSGAWGLWASAAIREGEVVEIRTRTGAIKRERVGKVVVVNEQAKKWLATIA